MTLDFYFYYENYENLFSFSLPQVHVSAEYIQEDPSAGTAKIRPDGAIYSEGSYLSASAEIGELEHCLTTDLLNHLVFVQVRRKSNIKPSFLLHVLFNRFCRKSSCAK